jgi:hypothetical protein
MVHGLPYRGLPDVPKQPRRRFVGSVVIAFVCAVVAIEFRSRVWDAASLRVAPMREMRIGQLVARRRAPSLEYQIVDATTGESWQSFVVTSTTDARGTGDIVWVRCADGGSRCYAPDQLPAAARFAEGFIGAWLFVAGLSLFLGWDAARRLARLLRSRSAVSRVAGTQPSLQR